MIKFGPSGNSTAFYDAGYSKSEESAVWVKEKDFSALNILSAEASIWGMKRLYR